MNIEVLEIRLADFPLFTYFFTTPGEFEFTQRVRMVCASDCEQYGRSWACPPGVGTVEKCREKCMSYERCLVIATITEVNDIGNLEETLATRSAHEKITDEIADIMRDLGAVPYVLSTESCAICERCAILDHAPCRHPDRMHPCVESQGINIIPILEKNGIAFQYGGNIVTWISLMLFPDPESK